jgi:hypothetical protein
MVREAASSPTTRDGVPTLEEFPNDSSTCSSLSLSRLLNRRTTEVTAQSLRSDRSQVKQKLPDYLTEDA